MSVRSSVLRLSAWSALSDMSLANISIIAVMSLPVQLKELSNKSWYGATNVPARDDSNPSLNEAFPQIQPFADIDDDGVYEYDTDDDISSTLIKDGPQRTPNTVAPEQNAEEHEGVNKPKESDPGERESDSSETVHDEEVHSCKRCQEPMVEGKAFDIGQFNVFNYDIPRIASNDCIAGNRWHIECFRCSRCDTSLEIDSNFLVR